MRLIKNNDQYVLTGTAYEDRFVPKQAGMTWNPQGRCWWTLNASIALKLAAYADDDLRAELLGKAEALPDPDKATLVFDDITWRYYSPYMFNRYAKDSGFRWSKNPVFHYWTEAIDCALRCYQSASAAIPDQFVCDPRSRAILAAEAARRAQSVTMSRAADADIDIPLPEGCELLPYQRAGVAYMKPRDRVLLGDEMRLGKTPTSIAWCNCDPSIRSVLVIVPATIKLNWLREWKKWSTLGLSVGVAWGFDSWPNTDVVIINSEILYRPKDKQVVPVMLKGGKPKMKDGKPVTKKVYPLRHEIKTMNPDVVIVDEGHRFKDQKTARYQCLSALQPRKRAALTGTPIPNRPIEIWPILAWLAAGMKDVPKVIRERWSFAMRFAGATHGPFGWDVTGASHLDELQTILRTLFMCRRLRSEVWEELPKRRRMLIEFPCPDDRFINEQDALWKRYTEISETVRGCVEVAEVTDDGGEYADAVRELRSDKLACFEEMSRVRHEDALKRIPFVIEHLKELLEEESKVVCFAWHNDVVEQIAEAFPGCILIYGKTSQNVRVALQDRFNQDPQANPCIISIAVCEGLDLSAASLGVMAEHDWVPKNIKQAEDRMENPFKRDPILIQYCVFQGSLDARMAQTLVEKEEIGYAALDKEIFIDAELGPSLPVGEKPALPEQVYAAGPETVERSADLGAILTGTSQNIKKNGGPELSDSDRRDVLIALRTLAGVCDGAFARDGAGFNSVDARLGHSLACADELTHPQATLALKVLRKYCGQLDGLLDRFYE